MPTKGYFLRVENFKHLEKISVENDMSESEYLNQLLERDRGGVPPISKEKAEKVVLPTGNIKDKHVVRPTVVETDAQKVGVFTFVKPNAYNPNICVACGSVKVAGRCINDGCKRKGKL
jgi:hypothetical protein